MSDNFLLQFFFVSVLTYLLCVPGIYIVIKTRLATSIVEAASSGFFLGFGFVVLTYLALARFCSFGVIDTLYASMILFAIVFSVRELRSTRLPVWQPLPGKWQSMLLFASFIFMVLLAFGELSSVIDDDLFIHLPNVKRISMGDIPPHVPFAPDTLLRGHCARDVFAGLLARLLQIRPELSIVYGTISIIPVYILMFYFLAFRLASTNAVGTAFCFYGTLFMAGTTIGDAALTRGPIAYVLNNNAIAYSYAVFYAWLLERLVTRFASANGRSFAIRLRQNIFPVTVAAFALSALYYVYISNFLMFCVYLSVLPLFLAAISAASHLRTLRESLLVLCVLSTISVVTLILVSPLVLERIATSLGFIHPAAPMALVQQAQLTFPKERLFSITDTSGRDFPFFERATFFRQGPSFFLGLLGFFFGIVCKDWRMAAVSLFGWMIFAWLMLVDMGQYRAETLRLLLLANMAFGASSGLVIGLVVEKVCHLLKARTQLFLPESNIPVFLFAAIACLFLGSGTIQKFVDAKSWNVFEHKKAMKRIQQKNPLNWHPFLSMLPIDSEIFECAQKYVHGPNQRLLIKMARSQGFGTYNIYDNSSIVNAGSITGAGITGVTQEYGPPRMAVYLFPYDYRSSLFWQKPSIFLLRQLRPDLLVLDPSLLREGVLEEILRLPGVKILETVSDKESRRRLLIGWTPSENAVEPSSSIVSVKPQLTELQTDVFGLVCLPVTVKKNGGGPLVVGLDVRDSHGKEVNPLDMPILELKQSESRVQEICFSMIQKGNWNIFFVEPNSKRRLSESPVLVKVFGKHRVVAHISESYAQRHASF